MASIGLLGQFWARTPPPPPSSLTVVSAEPFLLYSCSSLQLLLCSCFFPALILKHVIPEVLPQSLMYLALASGRYVLEPAGIVSIGHGGSFSQKTPLPCSPYHLLSAAYHAKPMHLPIRENLRVWFKTYGVCYTGEIESWNRIIES